MIFVAINQGITTTLKGTKRFTHDGKFTCICLEKNMNKMYREYKPVCVSQVVTDSASIFDSITS